VNGLRCLHGLDLTFEPLTALIGPNGAGKSSTVRAMEFLFGKVNLDEEDCTEELADPEISVTGVFTDIPSTWADRLSPWLDPDGALTISRTSAFDESGRGAAQWTTTRDQIEGFAEIRRMLAAGEPVTNVIKPGYQKLRERYPSLPAWQNKQQILAALDAYEQSNPDEPRVRDLDRTLSFSGGGDFDLSGMIELLALPAFRDAADDATESRGSNLTRLVELTVRSQMDVSDELHKLETRTAEEYRRIIADGTADRLVELSRQITTQLEAFAPGTSVRLSWEDRVPSFTPPW
jgi:energy-coupling factor transporter ATP-binding protein EcfA2